MILLFLLAVLLAIPTYGLSLAVYVGLIIVRGYLQAKARMHFANEIRAEQAVQSGDGRLPSWMADRNEISVFIEAVQQVAIRKGVPLVFSQSVMATDAFTGMLRYAGAMEAQGASFLEQQVSVVDKIVDLWRSAPTKLRQAARADDDDIPF